MRPALPPGAVIAVSSHGVRYLHGTGRLGVDDPTRPGPGTVFDLASLTKVIALTTGLMFAVEEGRIGLDDPIGRHVPGIRDGLGDSDMVKFVQACLNAAP